MSLITFIVVVAVIGFGLFAVNKWIPMAPGVKTFLNAAIVVLLVIWLLVATGIIGRMDSIRVPHI